MRTQLYRAAAVKATHAVFAEVSVLMPVGIVASTLLAVASATLLVAATFLIQIPDRVSATAVLMPNAGIVDIRAPGAGFVERLHVGADELVRAGQPLLDIGRDRATAGISSLRKERRESNAREDSLIRDGHVRRRQLRQTRRITAEARTRYLRRSHEGVLARERLAHSQLELAERRLGRMRVLAERGVVSTDQREQAEMAAAEAATAQLSATAEVAGVEHELFAAAIALDELSAEDAADEIIDLSTVFAGDQTLLQGRDVDFDIGVLEHAQGFHEFAT